MGIYLRPESLGEALAALADPEHSRPADPLDRLTPLAGGTDVYPARAGADAWGRPAPRNVLDLSRIPELDGISTAPDGSVRIGARVTWTRMTEAGLPPAFRCLEQAGRGVGGVQVQNRGTLVGNLCNASPAADGVPPLLALDAEVEAASARGVRRVPLSGFVLGNRRTALGPDELATAILVPPQPDGLATAFLKLGARSYLVISIVMVAAGLAVGPDGRIAAARIAVGACSAAAARLRGLEADLVGAPAAGAADRVRAEHLAPLSPIDDVRGTAAYRLEAALVMVRRALDDLGGAPSLGRAA
jgi:N-methylhydantoinase B